MAKQDLTQILTLHQHMQTLDTDIQRIPNSSHMFKQMTREYDTTMQSLVQLMGDAARAKLS